MTCPPASRCLHVNPDTLFPSLSHGFSQIVTAQGGKTVYLSGQTAWDAEKRIIGVLKPVLPITATPAADGRR